MGPILIRDLGHGLVGRVRDLLEEAQSVGLLLLYVDLLLSDGPLRYLQVSNDP